MGHPFTPTATQRRGRKRTLLGLLLLLLAAATFAATVWPWVDDVPWWVWLRPDPEAVDTPDAARAAGGHDAAWWCEALRPQLGLLALVLAVPALLTKRSLSFCLAVLALGGNAFVVGSTPVLGGWTGAVEAMTEAPAAGDPWVVLHARLAGADRLDVLAATVAAEQPDAVTAAAVRPGVAESLTPLLAGYRPAGSFPAAGDAGLAVWVRRNVRSDAARPDGPATLAVELFRGDDRLHLLVATAPPPTQPDPEGVPRLLVGGFDAPPWALPDRANPRLVVVAPGHFRPWLPLLDHARATLPAGSPGWVATTSAVPAITGSLLPLHRPILVRLHPPPADAADRTSGGASGSLRDSTVPGSRNAAPGGAPPASR